MAVGSAIIPPRAIADPPMPAERYPNITDRLQIVGPGITWLAARSFVKSSGVSQRRRSTRWRYANGRTPPNPDSAISENARNSVNGEIFGGTGGFYAGEGYPCPVLASERLLPGTQIGLAGHTGTGSANFST